MVNTPDGPVALDEIEDSTFAVLSWSEMPAGFAWADDGTGEVQPPYPVVRIASPQARIEGADRHAGEWYHGDRAMFEPVAEFVLLRRRRTRAMFGGEDDAPLCSSNDGDHPKPNGRVWRMEAFKTNAGAVVPVHEALRAHPPLECRQCPFSGQDDEETGEYMAGLCKASIVYLAARPDDSAAILRLTWTQARAVERWIRVRQKASGLPLFAYRLRLGTTRVMPQGGNPYYIATLAGEPEELTPRMALAYNDLLEAQDERFSQALSGGSVDVASGEVLA